MGYGDGSIYQRQRDGRWVAAVDAGFLPSGARRRKTFTGASKAEVRNRMLRMPGPGVRLCASRSHEPSRRTNPGHPPP